MNYILILVLSTLINSIAFTDISNPSLAQVEQLLEQLTTAKNLKNVEKSRLKDRIINQLSSFVSGFIASNETDISSLDTALRIAHNKMLLTQKTSPVITRLVASINEAYSHVKKIELERMREAQKEQQRIEWEQRQNEKERIGKESIKKLLDSVGDNDAHVIIELEGKITDEDAASIADFFKKHEKISSVEMHLDNLSLDNTKTILSGFEQQLETLKLVYQGAGVHSFNDGKYLAGFSNLKSLDISQQRGFGHGFSQLPQSIETLNLSGRVFEKQNFEELANLTNLRTLVLTNTKEWIDKGEKADIIRPLPEEWITALKAKNPGLVIVR